MTDFDIAIAHLVLADAKRLDAVDGLTRHWRLHLPTMLKAEHSGDCRHEPWTCDRCLADEAVGMAPVYRALFAGLGTTVTTVESPPFVFDAEPDDHRPQARGGDT